VRHNLGLYRSLYRHDAEVIAVDAHPEYLSTKHGREIAWARPVVEVQHHHAHIASCLAENRRPIAAGPVLGLALDGLGLGPDGTIWGGEFLLADYRGYRRVGCLRPVALPGGTAAVREPWRNAYAQLDAAMGWADLERSFGGLAVVRRLAGTPRPTLDAMIRSGLNTPLTSSCGRLFDAAAALAGIAWERQDYEGQAAMLFEAAIDRAEDGAYPFAIRGEAGLQMVDPAAVWPALLADVAREVPVGAIAARFHRGLAEAVVTLASQLCRAHDIRAVALSGGCFQNATLFRLVHAGLEAQGLEVLSHSEVPANDGGLALGQAAVALAQTNGGAHVPGDSGTDR
jgi:hydrogenase maturation protein HypF